MRLATYNVEWFYALFDDEGRPLRDGEWSKRYNVTRAEQWDSLVQVFRALDADGILVVEAPDSHDHRDGRAALERFAQEAGIRAREAVVGYVNDTRQEIMFLYDPDVLTVRHDPQSSPEAPRFDRSFAVDLDHDGRKDEITWSKPPLELAVDAKGFAFRLIGVHAKSKAPHGARDPEDARRRAIAARRKHLGQCLWLRQRVEWHLTQGESLVVLGDFNDGPGLDDYEALFGRSGVEVVLGDAALHLSDPHAEMTRTQRFGARPTTARFYLKPLKQYAQALLDYIMVSEDIAARKPDWRIWHPFDDPEIWHNEALRDAILTGSDHFPVTLDLELSP